MSFAKTDHLHKLIIPLNTLLFYSPLDESIFFDYIKTVGCIVDHHAQGERFYLQIDQSKITTDNVLDLMNLCARYNPQAMPQLYALLPKDIQQWLNRQAHTTWYKQHLSDTL